MISEQQSGSSFGVLLETVPLLRAAALVFAALKNRSGVRCFEEPLWCSLKNRSGVRCRFFLRFQKNQKNNRAVLQQTPEQEEEAANNRTAGLPTRKTPRMVLLVPKEESGSETHRLGFFCVSEEEEHQNGRVEEPLATALFFSFVVVN